MRALSFYAADGFTQIVGVDALGDIIAGDTFVPIKIGIRNDGDETYPTTVSLGDVGGSDGDGMAKLAADSATLSPPWGVTSVVSSPGAGGGWGATGDYLVVITRVNASGQTVASVEGKATVTNTTQTVTWNWLDTQTLGGDHYKVFRRAAAGTYASPSLIATGLTAATFVDTGASPSSGTPPNENTTAGAGPAYGTPPSVGVGPISLALGPLPPGAWGFAWLGPAVPTGTTADANTRFFAWDFA